MQNEDFDKARAKTAEAEQAARLAHANAEEAIKLLQASEQTSKEIEDYRKQYELQQQKLSDLSKTVSPNKPSAKRFHHPSQQPKLYAI